MVKLSLGKVAAGLALAGLVTAGSAWGGAFVAHAAPSANATQTQPTSLRAYLMDHFLANLAAKLGIDRSTLVKDVNDSLAQAVQDAQKDGKMTAEQADRLTKRIQDAQSKGRLGFFGFERPRAWGGKWGRFGGPVLKDAANVIGVSVDELASALKNGQSLAQVAQAHGVSQDALVNGLVDAMKKKLDQAVQNGRLTADQEQKILSQSKDRLTKLVTQPGLRFHRGPRTEHPSWDGAPSETPPTNPASIS
ncbi:MAG: hypothetical protein IRZ18_05435 [Clostridia bacterium]|nr:hypothetical protein [Clostridia bacterium]